MPPWEGSARAGIAGQPKRVGDRRSVGGRPARRRVAASRSVVGRSDLPLPGHPRSCGAAVRGFASARDHRPGGPARLLGRSAVAHAFGPRPRKLAPGGPGLPPLGPDRGMGRPHGDGAVHGVVAGPVLRVRGDAEPVGGTVRGGSAGLRRPVCDRPGCPTLGSGGHRTHGRGHGAHATTGCRGPRGGSLGRGPGDARIGAVDRGRDRGGVGRHAPLVGRDERSIRRASRSHRGRAHGVPRGRRVLRRRRTPAAHRRPAARPRAGWRAPLGGRPVVGGAGRSQRVGASARRGSPANGGGARGCRRGGRPRGGVSVPRRRPRAAVPVARARGAFRFGRRRPGGAPRSRAPRNEGMRGGCDDPRGLAPLAGRHLRPAGGPGT